MSNKKLEKQVKRKNKQMNKQLEKCKERKGRNHLICTAFKNFKGIMQFYECTRRNKWLVLK